MRLSSLIGLRNRRAQAFLATLFAAAYVGGYAIVRCEGFLIHYGPSEDHLIREGDIGWGFMFNPGPCLAKSSRVLFTPLRWVETRYWRAKH